MAEPGLEDLARVTGTPKPFGVTVQGFLPKPLARLLDEKLAAARLLFGEDVDLTSGSALRKLCELIAAEEARTWAHLGLLWEGTHVSTATGDALSALGAELGIPRPHHRARGTVTVALTQDLPADTAAVSLPRGVRLTTAGGHEYFLDEAVELTNVARSVTVAVAAFVPGPEQNLDPAQASQLLDRFDPVDARSQVVRDLAAAAGADVVTITHTAPTGGGETYWNDELYRELLLAYPRNLWTPDAVRVVVSLVPGVRQVIVRDLYGGLDINQSIFGNFSFLERLFSEERSLGTPFFFTVLVAPEEGAVWEGPGQLQERVQAAVDTVRPVGIAPKIETATQIGVGFSVRVLLDGVPVPAGSPSAAATSPEGVALRARIVERVRRYVLRLRIGEPVHYSEVLWAVMEEPGVADARELRLRRHPSLLSSASLATDPPETLPPQEFECEEDVVIGPAEVAVLVDQLVDLRMG
jgi:uncharacterized phage protein gp47/JayE